MGYHESLANAVGWLRQHQNTDGGWGLGTGQPSSIVNTAEAIYVIGREDPGCPCIEGGLRFIAESLEKHLDQYGRRTRYAAFALLAMLERSFPNYSDFTERWADWLGGAQNSDGGWGHEANDENSRVSATSLALIALRKTKSNEHNSSIQSGTRFLMQHRSGAGWNFDGSRQQASPTATAMAILALKPDLHDEDELISASKDTLRGVGHWNTEAEEQPGTPWQHCTYQWVVPALLELATAPYDPMMAEFVRTLNDRRFGGGWEEPDGSKTVRGQYWAVTALAAIQNAFDPSVHPYRIDSERAQAALSEPQFVNIRVRSGWAVILPASFYQAATYLLIAVSVLVLFGAHRNLGKLSGFWDFLLAIVVAVPAWFLIQARKHLFPKWIRWVFVSVLILLQVIDFLTGWSVSEFTRFWDYVRAFFNK